MKLCKDCVHYSKNGAYDLCDFVKSPIDGEAGAFADLERIGLGLKTGCGREGKHFDQKPVKVYKWKFWK